VTRDPNDTAADRVRGYQLDLRLLLRGGRVTGERRAAIEREVETLRLAALGVRTSDTRAILARAGVTKDGRRARVVRGPREWGEKTAVRLR
jgi:hypothetical protein